MKIDINKSYNLTPGTADHAFVQHWYQHVKNDRRTPHSVRQFLTGKDSYWRLNGDINDNKHSQVIELVLKDCYERFSYLNILLLKEGLYPAGSPLSFILGTNEVHPHYEISSTSGGGYADVNVDTLDLGADFLDRYPEIQTLEYHKKVIRLMVALDDPTSTLETIKALTMETREHISNEYGYLQHLEVASELDSVNVLLASILNSQTLDKIEEWKNTIRRIVTNQLHIQLQSNKTQENMSIKLINSPVCPLGLKLDLFDSLELNTKLGILENHADFTPSTVKELVKRLYLEQQELSAEHYKVILDVALAYSDPKICSYYICKAYNAQEFSIIDKILFRINLLLNGYIKLAFAWEITNINSFTDRLDDTLNWVAKHKDIKIDAVAKLTRLSKNLSQSGQSHKNVIPTSIRLQDIEEIEQYRTQHSTKP